MDAQELATRYKTAVEESLGLIAKIDDDKDVTFKHPDLGTFYFSLDAAQDPEYMMLVFPSFADERSIGGDRVKLLEIVNAVNGQCKAVKLSVRERDGHHNVTATAECFLAGADQGPTQELLKAIIKRTFSALTSGVRTFAEKVKAEKPGGTVSDSNSSM